MLGIMGAMPEEIEDIIGLMYDRKEIKIAMRTFHVGRIFNHECVVVFSRWGKVAAATTAAVLIHHFKVSEILFSGLAGSMRSDIRVGDLVIGRKFYQHDMDARPLLEEFEIPLTGTNFFESAPHLIESAHQSLQACISNNQFLTGISKTSLDTFSITSPNVWIGDIASGDRFFSNSKEKQQLLSKLPNLACVEMEGASVAQVAHEHQTPFTVIRTISDAADDHSVLDFTSFVEQIARPYTKAVINCLLAG
jgi:adenosylhomocysteine nucleosidase